MYTISSDHHCHKWSQFSKTNADGVNSRLRMILDELERQAEFTKRKGYETMFLAGDLFHVRGSIDPEVLNPTIETFQRISDMGINVFAIAGNHDLSGKYASQLGNAMQALDQIERFTAVTRKTTVSMAPGVEVVMIPWIEDLDELRETMKKSARPEAALIIHAPMNGVIKGIPENALTPKELADLGYSAVFVGHYHNHIGFKGNVYSVGATTHQTWSDPGTVAGFIEYVNGEVVHHKSEAPEFVDIKAVPELTSASVKGNYVRIKYDNPSDEDVRRTKELLDQYGCAGYVDHSVRTKAVNRTGQAQAGTSAKVAVARYVRDTLDTENLNKGVIAKEALEILAEAEQREAQQ